MTEQRIPEAIHVEDGRLSATVREVLADLGVATSPAETDADVEVVLHRSLDGATSLARPLPSGVEPADDLVTLCRSVVAGANVTGTVAVRTRVGHEGPVFVSLRGLE